MTTIKRTTGLRLTIAIVTLGLLVGCASVFQEFDDKLSRKRFKTDFESLATALDVYDQGDFGNALTLFKALKNASRNETVGRRAWLGEICCLLMLAETPAQFTTAVGMWHDFTQTTTDEDGAWSQALFDPLIVRQTPRTVPTVIEVPKAAAPPGATHQIPATVQKQAIEPPVAPDESQAEIETLRDKARRADELRLKLAKILAENRSLKEKIKALEAIDQNIQKKKTEISTSGE